MQDLESQSLWSQVSGECITGTLSGKTLSQVPAMHTTYAEFKRLYPHGVLLEKPVKGVQGSHYESYFADRTKLGIFGRANKFEQLEGKDLVFGLRQGNKQAAVSEEYLQRQSYAVLTDFEPPVILSYDSGAKTAVAFSLAGYNKAALGKLKVEGHKLILAEQKVAWNAGTGVTESGDAENLTMVPVVTAYWFAWLSFFPHTELIK